MTRDKEHRILSNDRNSSPFESTSNKKLTERINTIATKVKIKKRNLCQIALLKYRLFKNHDGSSKLMSYLYVE